MLNSSSDQLTRLSATLHSQLPMCATRCASASRVRLAASSISACLRLVMSTPDPMTWVMMLF